MEKRKIMIVIEEVEPGRGGPVGQNFQVYMAGDKDRIGTIPESQYTAAEFWASRLFKICANALGMSGAIKSVTPMGDGKEKQ